MIIFAIGYLVVGLLTVALASYGAAREGEDIGVFGSVVACALWPIFYAILVGAFIAERHAGGGK